MSTQEDLKRFNQRITAVGGESQEHADLRSVAWAISAHPALAERELVIPPSLEGEQSWAALLQFLREEGINLRSSTTPAEVADSPAGLSAAELAIAETGSVMLADNALQERIVSMLTLTHFVLVRTADLFPMLDSAGERLQQLTQPGSQQRRYITLITGPSRTADIERTLTIGVQGPKAICVIFVSQTEN